MGNVFEIKKENNINIKKYLTANQLKKYNTVRKQVYGMKLQDIVSMLYSSETKTELKRISNRIPKGADFFLKDLQSYEVHNQPIKPKGDNNITAKYGLTHDNMIENSKSYKRFFNIGKEDIENGVANLKAMLYLERIYNEIINDYSGYDKNGKPKDDTEYLFKTYALFNADRQIDGWQKITDNAFLSLPEDVAEITLQNYWTGESKKMTGTIAQDAIKEGNLYKLGLSYISNKNSKGNIVLGSDTQEKSLRATQNSEDVLSLSDGGNRLGKGLNKQNNEQRRKNIFDSLNGKSIETQSCIILASQPLNSDNNYPYSTKTVQPIQNDAEGIKRPSPEASMPSQQKAQPNANMAQQTQSMQQVASQQEQDKPIYQKLGDYFSQAFDNFSRGYQSLIGNFFTGNKQNE